MRRWSVRPIERAIIVGAIIVNLSTLLIFAIAAALRGF
jgi:hypothetical protein